MSRDWQDNAHEFGALSKQGVDVRLAVLVACSVEPGEGNPAVSRRERAASGKASATAFGREAGTTKDRVMRHLAAWDACAAKRWCKPSARLVPGDADDPDLRVPTQEQFASLFDAGTSGGRPRAAVTEIAARAARDKDYAESLVEAIADVQPSVVTKAAGKHREDRQREALARHGIDPDMPVEPFDAEIDAEAVRISSRLSDAVHDLIALHRRCEADQWPRVVARIEPNITRLLNALSAVEDTPEGAHR